MSEQEVGQAGMPPARPKPETSHTEIREGNGGRRSVPPRPEPKWTEIRDGGGGGAPVGIALLFLAVILIARACGGG